MIEVARTAKPGPETTAAQLTRRGIVANAILRTVEKAMEVAGGGSSTGRRRWSACSATCRRAATTRSPTSRARGWSAG